MNIKLIAVDIDDTFLSDTKTCSRLRFLTQYQRMRGQNIRFMVASGNQYYQLTSFFPEITRQIASVVENGNWVMSGSEDVFSYQLPLHHLNAVVDRLQTLSNTEVTTYGKRSAHTLNHYNDALETVAAKYHHRLELVGDSNHLDDVILRFGLNIPDNLIPEVRPRLYAALGDMATAMAAGYGSIDLIMPGVHKASGLRILQQRWGTEDHKVVASGNSGSDIEILQHTGFGFAIANAREDVKAVTNHHTSHNNEESVLQITDKVLNRGAPFA